MSVFQNVAAYSDRPDVRRFVLEMRVKGHEFLVRADRRQMPTACSGRPRRWARSGDRGAAWLWAHGQETDMLFFRMEKQIMNSI